MKQESMYFYRKQPEKFLSIQCNKKKKSIQTLLNFSVPVMSAKINPVPTLGCLNL